MRARMMLLLAAVALATSGVSSAQAMLLVDPNPPTPPRVSTSNCAVMTASRQPTEAELQARQFRQPQLKGRRLLKAVSKVTKELSWHDDLEEAAAAAAESGKPIFWVQALGDLKGYT